MKDSLFMAVVDSIDESSEGQLHKFIVAPVGVACGDESKEIAAGAEVEDHKQVLCVFEAPMQGDDVGVTRYLRVKRSLARVEVEGVFARIEFAKHLTAYCTPSGEVMSTAR
ncbi:hypothetical protein EVG20_g8303 [Dentipellis fragilis]|uniref:Uncharacterized protein n=1 Tax=Dentipellis fragilis TaxID=205917 RepID=A0A4Y9Y8C7_9AGAM|nr:hypothetical protein EVG20_g8303 [Dentipellis fragilis]